MAKTITPEAQAIAAAELAVTTKQAELAAAESAVRLLQFELNEARETLHEARVAADDLLPQCRMVSVRWRSGTDEDAGRVVILKKTPGGQLVTRRVGEAPGSECRFKWAPHSAKFVQAEKSPFFGSNTRELRDVPAEFLPSPTKET